ncbi:MAG TPA: pilus assembly PilX N-terminal domain-containing protein [Candidatus Acidoferrales bacterium]|nr:pilus assembly PilX N-terminal domain-containing protein [Candidatus Acidoferrales bacterium]
MKRSVNRISKNQEAGVALLLSIFVLLAISVVGIAMILASGTESALAGNYRASTSAYYAGMGGLEEGRARLLSKNPKYFDNFVPTFMPALGTTLAPGQVRYILNPNGGEIVAPLAFGTPATYPDNEYALEFGAIPNAANTQTITSTTSTAALAAGVMTSLYKWVRITPATEQSLGDHVANVVAVGRDVNADGVYDNAIPLFYDVGLVPPKLIVNAAPPSTAQQVFQITALAVLPNGTEKLLQYTVAARTFNLNFPSALTIGANNVTFQGANSAPYQVDGQDGSGGAVPVPGCTPNGNTYKNAIGTTNAGDVAAIKAGIPRPANYTGAGGSTPNVAAVPLSSTLDTPADVYKTVQTITSAADLVINGDATQADMPAAMSASNPMTVVVDGNFSMTGNFTGYGLLVVTGNFSYSGNDGWNGIVLVVGDGTTTYNGNGGGNNAFNGAIYVATIWDASRVLLPTFGPVSYNINGGGGNGIYYDSCWVKAAQQPTTYQVLSFREIPYND